MKLMRSMNIFKIIGLNDLCFHDHRVRQNILLSLEERRSRPP